VPRKKNLKRNTMPIFNTLRNPCSVPIYTMPPRLQRRSSCPLPLLVLTPHMPPHMPPFQPSMINMGVQKQKAQVGVKVKIPVSLILRNNVHTVPNVLHI
jgi:hypothetical protein